MTEVMCFMLAISSIVTYEKLRKQYHLIMSI